MIYLDNAATSRKKPISVYGSMFKNTIINSINSGRGGHSLSMRGMEKIVAAQDIIARLFNIDNPQNIAFTQNATYALNMAVMGTLCNGGHAVVTQMEHNSVLRPVYRFKNVTVVNADKYGYVEPEAVKAALKKDTKLIVCNHASNVCGTIEPIEEIGKIATYRGVPFLVDAAQTAGCLDIDVQKIGADMLVFSGHKGLMGPLGTGGLYVRHPELLEPIITGGTGSKSESLYQPRVMPDMLHSGTLNTPAIAALGAAVKFILKEGAGNIGKYENELAKRLTDRLINIPAIILYGADRKTGITAFNIRGISSAETAERLGKNIAVRAGYHCAPLAHRAIGTEKTGVVRVSFGYFNKRSDVDKAADLIYKVVKEALNI